MGFTIFTMSELSGIDIGDREDSNILLAIPFGTPCLSRVLAICFCVILSKADFRSISYIFGDFTTSVSIFFQADIVPLPDMNPC